MCRCAIAADVLGMWSDGDSRNRNPRWAADARQQIPMRKSTWLLGASTPSGKMSLEKYSDEQSMRISWSILWEFAKKRIGSVRWRSRVWFDLVHTLDCDRLIRSAVDQSSWHSPCSVVGPLIRLSLFRPFSIIEERETRSLIIHFLRSTDDDHVASPVCITAAYPPRHCLR